MTTTNRHVRTVRSADGTTIAYETSGEGPPIVLVGGAFNERTTVQPLAAALAPHFTAYAYDRRGRGDSGDTLPYAVDREVDDLAALIGAAGGAAYVYGLSSGAILAARATARGLPVTGLALFEPPFAVDGTAGSRPDISTTLAELIAADRRAEAVELFMTSAVGLSAEQAAGMRNDPSWPFLERMAHTLVYDLTITADGALPRDELAAVTVRTLVVDSTASPDWLRQAAHRTAEAVPGARRLSMTGGYHEVPPADLAVELRRFLLR
ncbi:alpha/beta fold hydrolase [Micromonospora sagamiensis]|uniref:Pimeloyl-ACP methyl ester carboxylesterase n=1 Tax=Micromonospora sagamiensis TaxID=47875 RepID=A0A562W8R7_9ACTN|nr:alpha/beta hydrolase [Micromonospora sagamiensis]TWJ26650.1 pimeloyl-ACP methyl ester carboxylesterase [Micromonospora sagamiensis]BCL14463.1 alpha/beta hydrolase [Micromonospora sagamiensis]